MSIIDKEELDWKENVRSFIFVPNRQVDAVFFIGDGVVERIPVLAFRVDLRCHSTYGEPIVWMDGDKYLDSCVQCENFLGLEFDGNEKNWDEEISRLKTKRGSEK